MIKDEIRTRYVEGLDILPRHMHGGISRYMERGVEPGGFLLKILQGRFSDAFVSADPENMAFEEEWSRFCSEFLPDDCHGSPLRVAAWMKMGGLDGYPNGQ